MEVEIEISEEEIAKMLRERIEENLKAGSVNEIKPYIHWGDQEFIGFTVKVSLP